MEPEESGPRLAGSIGFFGARIWEAPRLDESEMHDRGSYGVISKATPEPYLPPTAVAPKMWPLLSRTTPEGPLPSAPWKLCTTLYFHLPLFCGASLKITPQGPQFRSPPCAIPYRLPA